MSLTEIFVELYASLHFQSDFSYLMYIMPLFERALLLNDVLCVLYVFRSEVLEVVKNHTHLVISIPPLKGLGDPVLYFFGCSYKALFLFLSKHLTGDIICRYFAIKDY